MRKDRNRNSLKNKKRTGRPCLRRLLVLSLSAAVFSGTCLAVPASSLEISGAVKLTTFAAEEASDSAALAAAAGSDTAEGVIEGGGTIAEDGTYTIEEGSTGTITIEATDVTITGDPDTIYEELCLSCTSSQTTLTIADLLISNTGAGSAIAFTGAGNTLYLKGTSRIEQTSGDAGYATIHVGADAALTIADDPDDSDTGVLYLYKYEAGAGIGGNLSEANGSIIFESGQIFAKGSYTGALIGTGAECSADPGDITINGGELYLITLDGGAAIGGGGAEEAGTDGGNVYLNGGTVTINVDGTGAAIGGGGTQEGNTADGGQLIVSGGSLKTYIDAGAAAYWASAGVTASGVSEAAVTAEKTDANEEEAALYALNLSRFADTETYEILVDEAVFYNGGQHVWAYAGEEDTDANEYDLTESWIECEDGHLYLYLSEKEHALTINGTQLSLIWDEEEGRFWIAAVCTAVTGSGTVAVSDIEAAAGDTVCVSAEPDDGYYLAQIRYTYNDGTEDITEVVSESETGYSFLMPADTVTVTADFITIVWDGTIDVTWYDPDADTYTLSYGAQLAGAAALNNGLFNNYPTTTITEDDGDSYELPYTTAGNLVYGYEETFYNTFTSDDGATVVVGDITQIEAYCSTGSTGSNNLTTTDDYWIGGEDFTGKTILLEADLDMGGSYTGDRTDIDSWSGPNYMPLAGQYCMLVGNGYSKLSASFNGTFDGQGHVVYNIYCYRQKSGDYGDNQSVGLIGRLGVHDNDSADSYAYPVVQNVAVDGIFYANRSVGGIVGKNGRSYGSVIANCLNFATVMNTDAKGVGGIVGAGWNSLTIENCANFGYIYTSYSNAGGICGSCEAQVISCYNFGYVNASKANQAQALGTNNGGAVWTNCYYLTGSARSTDYPAVYNSTVGSTITEVTDAATFQSSDFLTDINAETRDWILADADALVSDQLQYCLENIYAYTSDMETYDGTGTAIPRTFTEDSATVTGITASGTPVTEYYSGKTFDADTFRIWANYSDGTQEAITDYTVTYENGGTTFAATDTTVTISGTFEGYSYSYTFDVSVTATELISIAITSEPDNVLYATGEYFDPTGMVVKATYSSGVTEAVTDYTYDKTDALTADDTVVTITYTYQDVTLTATQDITVLSSEAPHIGDQGVVEIETADDMMWFSNQVSLGYSRDAILMNDIDLSDTSFVPVGYTGNLPDYYGSTFDGNGMTITYTYAASGKSYVALFAGITEDGVIKDLTVKGSVSGQSSIAGIVARTNGGTIEDCTSYVTVEADSSYAGGICAYVADDTSISGCRNYGSVMSASSVAGGIAARFAGDDSVIASCYNYGDITGTYHLGGIVGQVYADNTIQDCGNEGTITGTSSSSSGSCGGIAGYYNYAAVIDSCYNSGTVATEGCIAGGIVGTAGSTGAVIANCYNAGAISTAGSRTGGLIGSTNASVTLYNCYNAGTVSYTGTSASDYIYVGAIAAYAGSGSSTLANAYNNYALEGTGNALFANLTTDTDSYASYVSADVLKTLASAEEDGESSVLGDAYTESPDGYNSGFPILTWQPDTESYAAALIDAIGDVTLDSGEAIALARSAYDALDDDVKTYVSNYTLLTEAESTYAALLAEQDTDDDENTGGGNTDDDTDGGDTNDGDTDDGDTDGGDAEDGSGNDDGTGSEGGSGDNGSDGDSAAGDDDADSDDGSGSSDGSGDDGSGDDGSNDDGSGDDGSSGEDGSGSDDGSGGSGSSGSNEADTGSNGGTTQGISSADTTGSGSTIQASLSKGKIKSLKNQKGRKIKVKYKKDKNATGYQIVYSTKKNFKKKKTVTVKSKKKTTAILKKLKKNKKYYVKVRSYKTVGNKTYYGAWSKVKSIKVKK